MNSGIGDKGYYQTYYSTRSWKDYLWLVNQAQNLSAEGTIVDLGCGAGFLVEAFSNSGYECIGIEGSEAGVKIARLRNAKLNIIHQPLSDKLPFPDNSIQTIILNQVIEHLESAVQEKCISEAYRILSKRGVIIIHAPSKYNIKERKADPTHINLLSPSELSVLLKSKGFHSLIELNPALIYILGEGGIAKKIINKIYNIFKFERLLANASFAAYK
jgi:SAM-dependent methyltransferase